MCSQISHAMSPAMVLNTISYSCRSTFTCRYTLPFDQEANFFVCVMRQTSHCSIHRKHHPIDEKSDNCHMGIYSSDNKHAGLTIT